jgi:hypothetical protein
MAFWAVGIVICLMIIRFAFNHTFMLVSLTVLPECHLTVTVIEGGGTN